MRAFRLLSICVWLLGCSAGDVKPGLSAPDDNQDGGAATPADAGEQHDPQTPDAATAQAHDASVDDAKHDAGSDRPYQHEDPNGRAVDAGARDPYISPIDAGERDPNVSPIDAGTYAADSGSSVLDAGTPPSTTTPLDAGTHAADSGTAPLDAGTQAADSGSAPADAGAPSLDAGPTTPPATPDAGSSTSPDAGATPDASAPPDAGPTEPVCSGPPGLYQDQYCRVLSPGIEAYQPQYPLWSDGAKKQRYIFLPSGTRIDTSNPNRWTFPVGTRLYKSFSAGDVLVETRVMEKVSAGVGFDSWKLVSYAWSADQHSVSPADPNGVTRALGTNLDIPSQANCQSCHNMTGADAVIGFNAIQLNHDLTGLALPELLLRQLLVNNANPAQPNIRLDNTLIPGDATTRAGLGYLHGNCGHCHGGPTPRAEQSLWSVVGMTELGDAPLMQTAQCHCLDFWRGRTAPDGQPYNLRVAPSHAAHSGIIGRMSSRIKGEQMPPVGTNQTDPTGLAAVKAFIDSLDGTTCDASPPTCLN